MLYAVCCILPSDASWPDSVCRRRSERTVGVNPVYSILHTVCCFCMFQYVFSGESEWTEQRIKQLQVLKDIAL